MIKNKPVLNEHRLQFSCRKEGIRTLDTVTRILPFQGSSFNHSDTFLFEIAKIVYFPEYPNKY